MAETNARYQQLPNEEDPEEGPQVAADAPPPYSSITVDSSAYFDNKEDGVFPKPPSYNVATTLPSYDEAERTKAETSSPLVTGRQQPQHREHLETFDDVIRSSLEVMWRPGRYGAISGFGLSLIKWILIVRFSTYFPGYFDGQYWLWWVFLVLGFLLFVRGFINYARIRKMADTLSTLPRTRVLFIY
uniref:Nedd4 family interacting protein 1 n=1 Tax=Nothobranchius kuhntae TaxID=321403 RepID=A0A1A8IIU1_NOTKU